MCNHHQKINFSGSRAPIYIPLALVPLAGPLFLVPVSGPGSGPGSFGPGSFGPTLALPWPLALSRPGLTIIDD